MKDVQVEDTYAGPTVSRRHKTARVIRHEAALPQSYKAWSAHEKNAEKSALQRAIQTWLSETGFWEDKLGEGKFLSLDYSQSDYKKLPIINKNSF